MQRGSLPLRGSPPLRGSLPQRGTPPINLHVFRGSSCCRMCMYMFCDADILESIFATPSVEPPATAYSQQALHDSSTHSGHAFAHSSSLPALMGMGAGGSSHQQQQQQQQQQQELLDRLRGATGLGLEGLDSLVGLAAKQAAKEEELASLRSQVSACFCGSPTPLAIPHPPTPPPPHTLPCRLGSQASGKGGGARGLAQSGATADILIFFQFSTWQNSTLCSVGVRGFGKFPGALCIFHVLHLCFICLLAPSVPCRLLCWRLRCQTSRRSCHCVMRWRRHSRRH
jgi:hypothetical protein